jgi:tetratricopeptide (TPR) repeat protein
MDPSPFEVAARIYLGGLLYRLGDAAGAEQLDLALSLVEKMPRSVEHGHMLVARADVNWQGEDPSTRQQYAEEALALEPAADVAAQARLILAQLQADAGQPEVAKAHADTAQALAERLGSPRLTGLALAGLGRIAASMRDLVGAAVAYEGAITALETARTPYDRALVLQAYSTEVVRHQQEERARAMLREALRLFEAVGARPAADRCRALLDDVDA